MTMISPFIDLQWSNDVTLCAAILHGACATSVTAVLAWAELADQYTSVVVSKPWGRFGAQDNN